MPTALKDGKLQEVKNSEVDIDLTSPNHYFSTHINLVPTPSAVQAPRAFYAEKFISQALPLRNAEAPLVQNLVDGDPKGRSFDELYGENAGAIHAKEAGEVLDVTPDEIVYKNDKGEKKTQELYHAFVLNRKTALQSEAHVKKGDKFQPGDLLTHSNFTDKNGTLALGLNARVGLVPFKGHSMDDAVVISQGLANRLTSDHYYQHQQDWDHDVKGGLHHYASLFPTRFTKDQLSSMDEHGVVKPGTVVKEGDPLILATRPKMMSSSSGVGNLSRAMRQARADGAQTWDDPNEGIITDVIHNKGNVKVVVHTQHPVQVGDKLTQRSGNKGTVSLIIPDEHMPRTLDGKPLEMLLNHLGIPSRVNDALPYELMLGKVAAKTGQPMKLPSFTKPGEDWHTLVTKALADNGLTDKEEVYDPQSNTKLENPITVGNCFIMKLHHESASKTSARGQGGYDASGQPLKGGGDSAQCFAPKQIINTAEGPIPIAHICEKRLRVNVRTWSDQRGEWVYRPVTDWFVRKAPVEDLLTVKFVSNCDRAPGTEDYHRTCNHACLMVTKNHHAFTPGGEVPIGSLKVGDELLTWGPVITADQQQLLIGSMLGDAYAHCDEDAIRIEHGNTQVAYVKWKQSVLSGLGAYVFDTSREKASASSVTKGPIKASAVTVGLPYVAKWARRFFYSAGKKTVTKTWVDCLTQFGFSVWFVDDGSTHWAPNKGKYCVEIATNSFQRAECELLRDWLRENTGVEFSISSRNVLVASNKAACVAIAAIVAKYIPWHAIPKSKGFLRAYCKNVQDVGGLQALTVANRLGRVPVEITEIKAYVHDKPDVKEINVYDFTVDETHNYCASSISVSNSKRLSGLEVHSMLSSGAYANIREGATIRGQKNDAYWRSIRAGHRPADPGSPDVWKKFHVLLAGAGIHSRHLGDEKYRLGPFTDAELEKRKPTEIRSGDMVNINTLEPVEGGLFSPGLVGVNGWGKVTLPFAVPNPGFETGIRSMLGLTQNELREILAGRQELPEHLR